MTDFGKRGSEADFTFPDLPLQIKSCPSQRFYLHGSDSCVRYSEIPHLPATIFTLISLLRATARRSRLRFREHTLATVRGWRVSVSVTHVMYSRVLVTVCVAHARVQRSQPLSRTAVVTRRRCTLSHRATLGWTYFIPHRTLKRAQVYHTHTLIAFTVTLFHGDFPVNPDNLKIMMTNRNEYGTFEVARPSNDATGTLADLGLAPLDDGDDQDDENEVCASRAPHASVR